MFHLGKHLGVEFLGQETAKPTPEWSCQHLVLSIFLMLAILGGVTDDAEPLFIRLLGTSSFVDIFIGIALNVWRNASKITIFVILSLLPHDRSMFSGLLLCSSGILPCSSYWSWAFLKSIPKYFIFYDTTINKVFPSILISDQDAIYSVGIWCLIDLTVFLFRSLHLQHPATCKC